MNKVLISLVFLFFLSNCCLGQSKKDIRLGLHVNYSSIKEVALNPLSIHKHFRTISPGIKAAYKKHELSASIDMMASQLVSPWEGFKKREPKGLSLTYQYSYLKWKQIEATLGVQTRFYEYFNGYNYGLGIANIAQSSLHTVGDLVNIKQLGPQLGLKVKRKRIDFQFSINLSKAKYRRYSLTISREYEGWATYLNGTFGICYWLN